MENNDFEGKGVVYYYKNKTEPCLTGIFKDDKCIEVMDFTDSFPYPEDCIWDEADH